MLKREESRRAWESALRLLNYRERSVKEVEKRLLEKHFSPGVIDSVIKKLKNLQLLDDEKFCRLWVRSRIRFRPRSVWLLCRELREKGVEEEIIKRVIEEELPLESELTLAISLAKKQSKYYQGEDPVKARRKLSAFLSRRGFSMEIIRKSLEEVLLF